MNKLINSVSRVIWDSDLISSRVTLALGEFFWAVMLLWPGDTFGRPTYNYMAMVMSEELWGMVFLITSIIQIVLVLSHKIHTICARYFAGWNAMLWSYTVVSMLLSVYPPPAAIGGEIAMALSAIWIWIQPYILIKGYRRAARY
jgi:hypothetical protein